MSNLTFRTLTPDDLPQMYDAFIEAFSQYSVNMNMSMAAFETRMLHKLKLGFDSSPAAFDGNKMVGFIFHTVNEYEEKRTAYNGGTGVLPDYWGQNITKRLHEFIIPQLKKNQVERCLLEVITHNEQAINAYKKVGFTTSKKYKCFKLVNALPKREGTNMVSSKLTHRNQMGHSMEFISDPRVGELNQKGYHTAIKISIQANWNTYEKIATAQASMLDSSSQLRFCLENETILEATIDNEIVAYAIFQAKLGRISQLAVSEGFRNQGIATVLITKIYEISEIKALTVINVEEHEQTIVSLLEGLGFENQINQLEMELLLTRGKS